MYRQASFQIDSLPDSVFSGYTGGGAWNGFDRPLFDFEVAQQVLTQSHKNGFSWHYNLEDDSFRVTCDQDIDGEDEVFTGEIIIVETIEMRVYPVGAGSWMWSELEG